MKKIGKIILVIFLCFMIVNIKVPTKQGINYRVNVYKIPLYVKIFEFISRDYRYRELVREIIRDSVSDKDKVMSIYEWTRSNIKRDIPEEWPIYDDHILNIIIRGYGVSDQMADVFTTLCAYAGLPAGWGRIEVPESGNKLVLSFVKIDGEWHVFDVFRGYSDYTNEDYFSLINWRGYLKNITSRTSKQMPFRRVLYEIYSVFTGDRDEK